MKRRYHLISIILVVAVVVGLYLGYANRIQPASTPILQYTYSISAQNAGNLTGVMNASQDSTQQVNLTFTSMISAQIAILIENPRLTAYKSTINYSNWDTNS
jgi:hypothetical protein